ASSYYKNSPKTDVQLELKEVKTPGLKTINDLSDFLKVAKQNIFKSVLYMADKETPVLAIVPGDQDVNEVKLRMALAAEEVEPATDEEIKTKFKTHPGYVGPVGLDGSVKIVADLLVQDMVNGVTGANQEDLHYTNVNAKKDFTVDTYADIRIVKEGDPDPDNKGELHFTRGIEIGHIFKLGTRYSDAMNATVLDNNGRQTSVIMGSYGIGVSRLLSAIAEQYADDKGLVWPSAVAPFDIHVIPVQVKKEEQMNLATELCQKFEKLGYSVLIDDRKERAGVKFTDAELIGIPVQIIVGKKASENIVEVTIRKTGERVETKVDDILSTVEILNANLEQK
ncbi:MAG: proline--tRNA ligase, partial [Alkalibacterium sp.]|nr:proline--tRNA ligase [Alkalibacterium sp.]